ncbi:hypothetical protein [Sphingomonas sp. BK069]|uniref:hypothetical protein n=1 Tax=Sphingomonas sp. BK069 TaxID=2586979 RepID=UPI00160E48A8|nr:hypothetical protein [Sphingomonas sp. BK069]MBB3349806.1 hypothetical protein [Sphingomonas sp. BK069]
MLAAAICGSTSIAERRIVETGDVGKRFVSQVAGEWRWVARLRSWVLRRRGEWRRLMDARISILVITLGIMILARPQGLDVVRDLVDSANSYIRDPQGWWTEAAIRSYFRWGCFLAACVWSGLIAWYWPHLLTRARVSREEPAGFRWLRRLLGIGPLLAGTAAVMVTGWEHLRDVWIALCLFAGTTLVLAGFFVRRRALVERRLRLSWWVRPSGRLAPLLRRLGGRHDLSLTLGDEAFVGVTFAMSVAVLVLFSTPVVRTHFAVGVGAASIAFGAVGSVIALASFLLLILFGSRLPVVSVVLLLIVLFSATNDNHAVSPVPSQLVARRPTLDAAFAAWERRTPGGPVILVATAGGASRAAYWTAAVLRAFDDRTGGRFGRQVFAISSVSGGTLAATGYAAWLADQQVDGASCPYDPAARLAFDRAFVGADYLSPAIAGLLYPDLTQSTMPLPVFRDRASSLEEGWSIGWTDAVGQRRTGCAPQAGKLAADFLAIWESSLEAGGPWVPLVLANGTLVEDGKRVITAPIRVEPAVFEDSHDFVDLFGRSVSGATAILNSARFPLISPAATVPTPGGTLHLVDGGYFENGGLETLYDVARHIRATVGRSRPILIIEINNDDDAPGDPHSVDNLARYPNEMDPADSAATSLGVALPEASTLRVAAGVRSVVGALYGTRTSRGVLGAKRLSSLRAVGLTDTYRATFNLGPLLAGRKTAMSWSLSLSSRNAIDAALTRRPPSAAGRSGRPATRSEATVACQRAALNEIARALGADPGAPEAGCPLGSHDAQWVGVPLGLRGAAAQ